MPGGEWTIDQQDQRIAEAFARDEPRLRRFIRRRVRDTEDVEDVLQDVFYELVAAYRFVKPVEQITAWLYRVAANRVIDLFRRRRTISLGDPVSSEEGADCLEDLLPSLDAGPDALYARQLLFDELEDALEDLPEEQRSVFIAHEFPGRSFKEIAEETGVKVNTLLSRKRYAVLALRQRLQGFQERFGEG
jgi:RNA polymerase sigma factor (sigma-70 family)